MHRVPLFAALFLMIDAATIITAPMSLGQCQMVHVNVTGDPPLHLQICVLLALCQAHPYINLHNQTLDDLGSLNQTTNSVPWMVDIVGGTRVQFLVTDKTGAQTFSNSSVIYSTSNRSCLLLQPSNELAAVQSSSSSTLSTFLGSTPTAPVVLPQPSMKPRPWMIAMMVIVIVSFLIALVLGFVWIRRMYRKPRLTRVSIMDDYEIIEPRLRLPQNSPNWNRTSVAPSIYEGYEGEDQSGTGDNVPEEEEGLVSQGARASPKRTTGRPSLLRPTGPRLPRPATRKSQGGYSPIALYNSWRS